MFRFWVILKENEMLKLFRNKFQNVEDCNFNKTFFDIYIISLTNYLEITERNRSWTKCMYAPLLKFYSSFNFKSCSQTRMILQLKNNFRTISNLNSVLLITWNPPAGRKRKIEHFRRMTSDSNTERISNEMLLELKSHPTVMLI